MKEGYQGLFPHATAYVINQLSVVWKRSSIFYVNEIKGKKNNQLPDPFQSMELEKLLFEKHLAK